MDTITKFEDRPSYRLYTRDARLNREQYETTFELAYDMGKLDAEAGLTEAADQPDWPWYENDPYTEGYRDGYADFQGEPFTG